MSILTEMFLFRANAFEANCRVVRWRLSDAQAHELADFLADMQILPFSTSQEIYEGLKEGRYSMIGAMVEVR